MKRAIIFFMMLIPSLLFAAPDGYFEVSSSPDGTKFFMHYDVSSRSLKYNPKDVNVIADIWQEDSAGSTSGYKQAFKCNEPGAAFNVISSSDGGLSRRNPTYFVKGSVGYSLWQFACALAYPTKPRKAL